MIAEGARATQQMFGNIGQTIANVGTIIDKHQGMADTSALSKDAAEGFDALTRDWNDTVSKADPNDTSVAEKWRQEVLEPYLDKFGQDVGSTAGVDFRERAINTLRNHFIEKTLGDQSALSGSAVKTNLEQSVNSYSQAAYNDPSSAETAITLYQGSVETQIQSHTLTGEQAAQVRASTVVGVKQIALGAVRGMADKNPQAAIQALDSGRFDKYLNGEEKSQAKGYATAQQKAKDADARRVQEDARRDAEEASDKRRNDIMRSYATPDGGLKIPKNAISAILADPTMTPADKDALIGITKRLGEPDAVEMKNDPATYLSLFNRIHLPDGNPQKIKDADQLNQFLGKGLNYTGLEQLRHELVPGGKETLANELKTRWLTTARNQIVGTNPLLGIRDPKGDELFGNFLVQFLPAYEAAVAGGANPADLLKPNGQFDQMLAHYKRTPAQQMQDIAGAMGQGGGELPVMKTPADAQKLAPGTHYKTPDGREMVR